jgi:hypothetical protein
MCQNLHTWMDRLRTIMEPRVVAGLYHCCEICPDPRDLAFALPQASNFLRLLFPLSHKGFQCLFVTRQPFHILCFQRQQRTLPSIPLQDFGQIDKGLASDTILPGAGIDLGLLATEQSLCSGVGGDPSDVAALFLPEVTADPKLIP